MNIFSHPEIVDRYLEDHSSREDPLLAELTRYTYLNEAYPRMLSGPILGRFLTLFSQLVSPGRILEVGTFTGYSAICLARGLKPGGTLTTIENNEELRQVAMKFFQKADLQDKIELINGDALQIIPGLQGPFDLVFLDASKEEYGSYYDLIFDKVPKGGFILADNALWGGKVLGNPEPDETSRAIHHFNEMITRDQRIEHLLLPIRDGIMIIRKQ
jgi:caffeoyl-CoA O-methyltransferase